MSTNNRLTISTVTPGYWRSAMSSRPLVSATCPVPPATDPVGPLTRHTGVELATAHHFDAHSSPRRVRSSSVEAADKPGVSPRLYGTVQGSPPENAARILIETERVLRIGGHRKVTVADIADACGFSAANVYRYFSSRSVMLDTLASHYLHETERAALACAIRNSSSARDRLSGLLTGLNTALMIFAVRAAGQPVACRCHGGAMAVLHPL
jgi:hypothetical protein